MLLSMILLCSLSYAQSLVVTPLGLRDANDPEKTFVVINADGKTAKELYDIAIKYINKNYKSTNDDIKGNTIELNFKDGRVKYEVINLQMNYRQNKEPFLYNGKNAKTTLDKNKEVSPFLFIGKLFTPGIYTPNLSLKRPKAKAQIEDYFNSQIKSFADALNGKNNNDNW